MTGERNLPNQGITNRWQPGSNGWNTGMDRDLLLMDTLLLLCVKSATLATPPAAPANGDRYIVAAGPTDAWAGNTNAVAVFLDNAWFFFPPQAGWSAYVLDENYLARFNGVTWPVRSTPYDIQVWRHRLPEIISEPLLSLQMPRTVLFPAGFTASVASCRAAPNSSVAFNVQCNGATVGTVNFAAGSTTGTFAMAADTRFNSGDIFDLFLAASADPAFSGLRICFAGNR